MTTWGSYILQMIYLKVGTWAEFFSEVRVHIPRPAIIVCLEDLKLYIISWWAWHYWTQGHILLFLSPRDVAKSSNSSLRCRDAGYWRLKITLSTHYWTIKNLVRTDNWADKSVITLYFLVEWCVRLWGPKQLLESVRHLSICPDKIL